MSKSLCLAVLLCAGAAGAGSTVIEAPAMVITSFKTPRPDCQPAKPIAPDEAIAFGLTGTVRVEYVVYPDGHVGDSSLARSTAHPALGDAVKRWLGGCAYVAGAVEGKPIALRVSQLFIFKSF